MAHDDQTPPDPRATRTMRRDQPSTDRLGQGGAYGDPVNPNWRSDRPGARGRGARSMPFSRQEFALWLQYGGWRFLLAAAAILMVAAALYILSQPPAPLPLGGEEPAVEQPVAAPTLPVVSTVTPSAATPAPTAAPTSAAGQQLRVTGTEGLGLFLRPAPSTNNQPIKTLPDDTVVTVLEGPTSAEGRSWLRVRDASGAEGWAAAEFLKPVQ
ncbi:MAG TPA: SH3 domain-containing protein [Roseiflexaceae bacterium]|nr:SH3 domain-containing protein [Roseiflexaceae bacterium]